MNGWLYKLVSRDLGGLTTQNLVMYIKNIVPYYLQITDQLFSLVPIRIFR